jgi:hypothetical protein
MVTKDISTVIGCVLYSHDLCCHCCRLFRLIVHGITLLKIGLQ